MPDCFSLKLDPLEDNFVVEEEIKNGDDFLELLLLVAVEVIGCMTVEGVFIEDKALKVFEIVGAEERSLLRFIDVVGTNKVLFILFLLEIVVFECLGILLRENKGKINFFVVFC